jgi:hypothetical protein
VVAFKAATQLIEAYRSVTLEAAKLRFQLNFGTPGCNQCDGLHAGPGVSATCFQMKQCHYSNLKEGEGSSRQLRVLKTLTEIPK